MFKSVTLLTVNLAVLLIITIRVYVISNSLTLLNQNIMIFVLFLCSNTLLDLFMGVLTPLNEIKKTVLTETIITKEDVSFQNIFAREMSDFLTFVAEIDGLSEVDEAQKNALKEKALCRLLGIEQSFKVKANDEERGNDQL